jgi:hypothetical protein
MFFFDEGAVIDRCDGGEIRKRSCNTLRVVVLAESGHVESRGDDSDQEVEAHVHHTGSDGVAFVQELSCHHWNDTDADLSGEDDLNERVEPRGALPEHIDLERPHDRKEAILDGAGDLPARLEYQKSHRDDPEHQHRSSVDSAAVSAVNRTDKKLQLNKRSMNSPHHDDDPQKHQADRQQSETN